MARVKLVNCTRAMFGHAHELTFSPTDANASCAATTACTSKTLRQLVEALQREAGAHVDSDVAYMERCVKAGCKYYAPAHISLSLRLETVK